MTSIKLCDPLLAYLSSRQIPFKSANRLHPDLECCDAVENNHNLKPPFKTKLQ